MSKPRVVIAMSGGVDSSVAAALLKEQGYDVIGITMQIWPKGGDPALGGCCSLSAIEDARRVAAKIGIPHYVLNFREPFARNVIDNFIEEYRRGHTPNPCVRCNQFLKFDLLLHRARELDAEYVATGHYARIRYDEKRGRWLLLKGRDPSKDQAYALYTMTQDQLEHTLFPIGDIEKNETRRIAADLDLAVAKKPDSQDICFVTDGSYKKFLLKAAPEMAQKGPILDTTGKILGEHSGIAFYTVGQRRHLGITSGKPLYVVKIEPETNTIIVGEENELYSRRFVAKEMNFISVANFSENIVVSAAIRYNMADSSGTLRLIADDWVEFEFEQPQKSITPGQAAVFYQGEEVFGGGIIADEWEEKTWLQAQGLITAAAG